MIHSCRENNFLQENMEAHRKQSATQSESVIPHIFHLMLSEEPRGWDGKLSHHTFKPELTEPKRSHNLQSSSHNRTFTQWSPQHVMDLYFQGPTGLSSARGRDEWFPSSTFNCKNFPSCKYAHAPKIYKIKLVSHIYDLHG